MWGKPCATCMIIHVRNFVTAWACGKKHYVACRHPNTAVQSGNASSGPAHIRQSPVSVVSNDSANQFHSQQQTALTGKQQQVQKLQQQVNSLHQHFSSLAQDRQQVPQATGKSFGSKAKRQLLQESEQDVIQALQRSLTAVEAQLASQAETIYKLQREASVADTHLEKVTNLLQSEQSHAQRLEEQLDGKADSSKTRFAKLSQHLEAERRTVKALRTELQSLSASSESHVSRLATELEAKQGLLRGLQTTVQAARADAESSKSQAEAASSALTSLKDAGVELERLSAQLIRERQVSCWQCLSLGKGDALPGV